MQTETQKSNALTSAASGLERLIGLGIGAYQAVTNTKLEKQLAQQTIQQNQHTPAQSVPAPGGMDQRTLMVAGGAALGLVLLVVLIKK